MRENMAYQALYRKWRPLEFEDVKGQEHIVTTLKNQIRGKDFCKGGQLRASGGRQSVRGMSDL